MEQVKLVIPTFNEDEDCEVQVPVLVQFECGVRVILGTHDATEIKPDIFIERRPGGWVICIHPDADDSTGYVVIGDDGSNFAIPECGRNSLDTTKTFEQVMTHLEDLANGTILGLPIR